MSDRPGPLERRQRYIDPLEANQAHLDGRQAQIHTMMPGIIVAYDPKTMTATVQPAIKAMHRQLDRTRKAIDIVPIPNVPVHFPGGGGHTLTFPVKVGDECTIQFAERSIDNWHQHGGTQEPSDLRMHDITDAICHVGLRSQPKVPANVSADTVQLRSDNGEVVVEIDGAALSIKLTAQNVTVGKAGGNLGVLGAAPIAKPTITGTINNATALKNLLQFLQQRGDLIDASV